MNLSSQDWRRLFELLDGVEEPQREAWLKQLEGEKGPISDKLRELMSQRTADDASSYEQPSNHLGQSANLDAPTLMRKAPGRSEAPPASPDIRRPDVRRSVAPPPPMSDVRGSNVPSSNTDSRWDSPHTWTGVFDEPVRVGTLLSGRYLIERELGEGGMGTVFLAQDKEENQPFAIKVLKENFRLHPDALKALREEVIKSRSLASPNNVGVYDLNRDRSTVYVKMEYLQGKSLDTLLDDDFARGMPLNRAWPIIEGVCNGLALAHDKGVIHSDIKPSNIFVTTGGNAKVLDYGIARAVRGRAKRYDPGELGALTPAYASCEMLEHQEPDVRDDVYSLACVVYELLTGKHPFTRQRATEARDKKMRMAPIAVLSRSQNATLAKALAFQRAARTPSIEAFLAGMRDTRAKRLRLLARTAAAAAIVASIVAGGWYVRAALQQRDADEAYLATLLKPNAERSADYDPQMANDLLDQGEDYLRQARQNFDPALLSEGTSTAFGAFMSALKLDRANRKAAEGALAVVRLYQAKARSLEREQQYKRALELVTIALKLSPADEPLKALKEELTRKVQSTDAGQS